MAEQKNNKDTSGHHSGDSPHVHGGWPGVENNSFLQRLLAWLPVVPQSGKHQPETADSMAGDKLYRLRHLRKNLPGDGA